MWIQMDSVAMKHIEDMWTHKNKDEVWILWLKIEMDGVNPSYLQILILFLDNVIDL